MAPELPSLDLVIPTATDRFNEAGANWPRNYQEDQEPGSRVSMASMRPGPIGPGIGRETFGLHAGRYASMRPGPIGPGIGFNELPESFRIAASMRPGPIGPGIPVKTTWAPTNWRRFNEAGANWPRNYDARPGSLLARDVASMRPGPIGPGIAKNLPKLGTMTECFNEAGANWPRN